MIAALSTGLVVVPVTGVVAVTLVSQEPLNEGPDPETVAAVYADYAAAMADSSTVITASSVADYSLDVPDIDVEIIPPPAPARSSTGSSSARPVANSKDVQAAISGSAVIAEASKYVGVKYVSGGNSPSQGFDCSGFVHYVFKQLGIKVPRQSSAFYNFGTRVSSPQPGDIILTPGHVGIYAGPNLQIDAPTSGGSVQFRAIWQSNPIYVRVT